MNTWIKKSWFIDFVSNMREAITDARLQIENRACRLQTDIFLKTNGLHAEPQTLSEKELITELGKTMILARLAGQNLAVYEDLYSFLPGIRLIRDAIFSAGLHQHIKIPPTPPVIIDVRIPVDEFWNEINRQVFVIPVDD